MPLADCRFRLGENREVVELLVPIEKSSPDNLAIIYMLGTALVRDRQPERGRVLINPILRNEDSVETRVLLGTTKILRKVTAAGALVSILLLAAAGAWAAPRQDCATCHRLQALEQPATGMGRAL